jgi:Ca2+-binding EF-hand superfamily protein
MMSRGMARGGMMGPGASGQDAPIHSMMMHMMFALIDADGDGAVSLQEFQAAHERIFRAMDSNKDGRLSFEEMENFMHGSTRPAPVR